MGFSQNGFGFGSAGGGGGGGSVSGAANGLSVFGTDAVLGQDFGDVSNPAALSSAREIPFNGNPIVFTTSLGANIVLTETGDGSVQMTMVSDSSIQTPANISMQDLFDSSTGKISQGAGTLSIDNGLTNITLGSPGNICLGDGSLGTANVFINTTDATDTSFLFQINGSAFDFSHQPGISIRESNNGKVLTILNGGSGGVIEGPAGGLIVDLTTGEVAFTSAISTGDPGGGQGHWLLGKVITAASVLDGTRYVETEIDGVVVRLAVAA